jgi:cellulose synthase/poly-beta-1,6-N-acetylglucosamine synthase-like glycosyltransferase
MMQSSATQVCWSVVFWMAAAFTFYAYAGYLCWLGLRAMVRPWPVQRGVFFPTISIVMVVRNEAAVLRDKLRNLLALDYPAERCQLVVVSDGSTDGTEEILREAAQDPRVHIVLNQLPQGKASGLNDGVGLAGGEVVVFSDARQYLEENAPRLLMENFVDPRVGAVSGELMLGNPVSGETKRGMGVYWRMEKRVRELEAASGSVVGATGALYAVRRHLIAEVPPETLLDDVFIPMQVARRGCRVVFDSRARAWDSPDLGAGREFRRKVRTLTGNYQLLRIAPWLLRRENPLRFAFISHKLTRLAVPAALLAIFIASCVLTGTFYRVAFWMQIAGYGLSVLGLTGWNLGPLSPVASAAATLVVLNGAAVVAFANFITGQKAEWMQPARPAVGKEMRA